MTNLNSILKIRDITFLPKGHLVKARVKNLPAMQETWVQFLGQEDPLEKEMATHSSVLAGESQGRGSLLGCRLWGRTVSDTTEAT